MINAGTYSAKPIEWGIGETKNGDPQAVVHFKIHDADGSTHNLTWYGSFKEKVKTHTIKALINCGLQGNDLDQFGLGSEGKALDKNREIELVVSQETMDNGKTYARVKWINLPSGSRFRALATPQEAKSKLASLNLKAEIMAVRQSMPEVGVPKLNEDEELPF